MVTANYIKSKFESLTKKDLKKKIDYKQKYVVIKTHFRYGQYNLNIVRGDHMSRLYLMNLSFGIHNYNSELIKLPLDELIGYVTRVGENRIATETGWGIEK
jgi:hypothetical protein